MKHTFASEPHSVSQEVEGVNKDKVTDKERVIIKVTKWALRAFKMMIVWVPID